MLKKHSNIENILIFFLEKAFIGQTSHSYCLTPILELGKE